MDHTKSYSRRLLMKGKLQTSSRPRLSGKVAASAVERGKLEQTRKNRDKYEYNHKPKRKPPPCLLSGGLLFPEIDLYGYFTL